MIDPNKFIITRKRKKYKFAQFSNLSNCFEADEWRNSGQQGPFVIELGAGTGYFALEQAKLHPELSFVAVDVKADRLQAGARRALEQGVGNIVFLRARVDQLGEIFEENSAMELWLTFSDPYPKKRHAKHRMTHPRFLQLYVFLLVPNGELRFKTDSHELFDWSLEQLVTSGWHINELSYDLHNSNLPDNYKVVTTYEERFLAERLSIYFVSASC